MRWIEAAVDMAGRDEGELCSRLEALGVGGFVIEDEAETLDFLENNKKYWDYVEDSFLQSLSGKSLIKFYLSDDEEGRAILARIRSETDIVPAVSYIRDEDWENNWREFYRPIPVGERLMVVPEWESPELMGRLPLRLDPGLIFGTGSHATTRMCLCALEKLAAPERTVLDIGCGSGILAIGALVLGCKNAIGCDIDDKAPDVALSNAALNGIGPDRLRVLAGDVLAGGSLKRQLGTGHHIVLANIVADVIISLAPMVRDFMRPDGVFVCSGIIEGRQDEVADALAAAGLRITAHASEDDWHCYTAVIG